MSNHVNAPHSGATPAPEWTRSTSGASIRRVMVTSVVTVLVAAAVTATSVYLIADEAPTTGVFRDPVYASRPGCRAAAGRRNRSGNRPGGHPQVRRRRRCGVGSRGRRLAQMVYAIDPATNVTETLGLGTVRAQDDSPAIEQLVWGIDPSIDVRAALGLGTVPARGRLPSHRGAGPGDRPIDRHASRSRVERSRTGTSTRGPRSRPAQCADTEQAGRTARVRLPAAPSARPATRP